MKIRRQTKSRLIFVALHGPYRPRFWALWSLARVAGHEHADACWQGWERSDILEFKGARQIRGTSLDIGHVGA